ncbi:MAG: Asp-tRNA(Asn)/Glu-tRNA(Gln) amidotransferase subunit GatB, partial [bacterium]|nr:Asp-tRNA(Asn)/Glu-tRNA(Gln) amidotransferase subunit GatB [bacterium]
KGYQISQLYEPLCINGYLEIGENKIRIREIHLEEDTGKLIHPEGKDYSLVDFNRAGIPLMELVTEPDITSAKEARKFAQELHLIMHYLNISDADMEKGQMRIEVNISLSKEEGKLGTKVEIKNLNSFRSVERAVDYEIERQEKVLKESKKIIQETRGWLDEATASSRRVAGARVGKEDKSSSSPFAGARVDDVKGITVSQREKEEAHDYRYFPEPDLPPLHFSKEFVQKIKSEIPELPQQRRERLKKEYGLLDKEVEIFVYNKDLGEYFEKVVSEFEPNLSQGKLLALIKLAANYLITDLQGLLKGTSVTSEKFLITPENFAEFIALITERGEQSEQREGEDERSSLTYQGKISSKIAKMVLLEMFKTGADPSNIIEEKGLTQIIDEREIKKIIEEVINNNPKPVEDYKKGKESAFQFLIGQAMAVSKGKANPQVVNEILRKTLTKIK